ncbi:DUF4440 domain-containing protein [Aliikangiella sp. G2MR2-5]|uniref:nuclear transport factor 2 family protein n=1 Tax=Aliikangiella sp. G2MR2-5 TaxID=2788943 RepID=UPI0018ABFE18|nr:DUF4440 domain-containing protein [Aliikangiella sp. G2MR2-5]
MDIIISREISLHKFNTRQNPLELKCLIHPDFREIGRSGKIFDFDSIVEMMKAEEPSDYKVHSQGFKGIQLEASSYLLTYQSARVDKNGEVSNYAMRSSIWLEIDENWQLIFHQGTPCEAFELE